ncbi:MAG TPA: argininosuccinate lyase [Candidatus Atribacteria bacterium]|nr:argininosuccinate lyase [Candidatus Atribacteria bacterium]
MTNLWGSRMEKGLDQEVKEFSTSIPEDFFLYKYDLWGSAAHCKMLEKVGIISEKESKEILRGLRVIFQEIEEGKVDPSPFEDIHSLVEIRLREIAGEEIGGKLHTARSRNDQVVLDERLFLREKIGEVVEKISFLQEALLRKAQENKDVVMPGYTHLQPAQPVLFAHHLLAYFFMFQRDIERLEDTRKRVNVLPLGAGALSGTSLPIDRQYVAELLAFPRVQENSMDAVSDRDFILEFLGGLSILFLHLSRWGEEIVLWSSPAFHFLEIDDAFTTGSSIMPQKKNPDVAELLRGKTGEVLSSWVSLAITLKGLPLTYNRDLQQDKPPLFRATKETLSSLRIAARLTQNIFPDRESMKKALSVGFLTATDLCEYLVGQGVPFRRAHAWVGEMVKKLSASGKHLRDLKKEDWREYQHLFPENWEEIIDEEKSVRRKISEGSTSPREVEREIKIGEELLAQSRERVSSWRKIEQESWENLMGGSCVL